MTQPVKFGLNVDPNTGGLPIAERITAIADASGLDLVGIQDHPYNADFTDTLTLITWLAARTRHVHLFPNVANLPLRPPVMLAKQAATIERGQQRPLRARPRRGSVRRRDRRDGRSPPQRRAGTRRAQ